jgi:hypothetical protein
VTEVRKDGDGRILGPRARDPRSHCERQIAPKDPPPVDVQGHPIDGP